MKKKIRTFVVAIMLVVFTATGAYAVLPLVYWGVSIALHSMAIGGYVWWSAKRNGSSSANGTTGNVVTPTNVQWVDLTGSEPQVKTANPKARVNHDDVKAKVNEDQERYEKLKEALMIEAEDTYPNGTTVPYGEELAVGTYINSNGRKYRIDGASQDTGWYNAGAGGAVYGVVTIGYCDRNVFGSCTQMYGLHVPTADPNPSYIRDRTYPATDVGPADGAGEASPVEFASKINGNPDYYTGEIDDLIKSNPNIVHWDDESSDGSNSDDGTYDMPTAPTPEKIADATSGDELSENQTSPFENYTTEEGGGFTGTDVQKKDVGASADGVAGTFIKKVNELGAAMKTHAPFSYWTYCTNYLSVMLGNGSAPEWTWNIPPSGFFPGQDVTISLSWMEGFAEVSRFIAKFLFTIAMAWSFKGYWHRE